MGATMMAGLIAVVGAELAGACSCGGTWDPCEYLRVASDVVVSEVVWDTGWLGVFPVRVVEVLKGELKPGSIVFVWGSGRNDVRRGERLLQFREKGGDFQIRCCGPTYWADQHEHWLEAMRNAIRGGPPMLVGKVLNFQNRTGSFGLEGVKVDAECGGRGGSAVTNESGQFVIGSMGEGRCAIRLEKPGYAEAELWKGREVVLSASCVAPTFVMR